MKNQANKNSKNLTASISEAGIDSKASAEMINGEDRVCSICNTRASDHVDMDHPWRNFAIEAAERIAAGDTEWTRPHGVKEWTPVDHSLPAECDKCGVATADCDCYVENHGQTVATFAAPRRIAGTDEYVVIARDHDGKRVEAACYYTDDLDDAKQTRAHMQKISDENETAMTVAPNAARAPRGFAPFTKHDWDAFSGCESKTPFIAHDSASSDVDWTFIVDDRNVDAYDDGGRSFHAAFDTVVQAHLIAELLLSGRVHTALVLEEI